MSSGGVEELQSATNAPRRCEAAPADRSLADCHVVAAGMAA
jgi:hypothetical protein